MSKCLKCGHLDRIYQCLKLSTDENWTDQMCFSCILLFFHFILCISISICNFVFVFVFSIFIFIQGDRECRNACGWIKYQQHGGWAATGVQRNTLWVFSTFFIDKSFIGRPLGSRGISNVLRVFYLLKGTLITLSFGDASFKEMISPFNSCECPSSTECRYSHTDTTWGVAVYTCNTEVNWCKNCFF